MNIGISGKLLTNQNWSGQQNYLHYLLQALAKVDRTNNYTIYVPKQPVRSLKLASNFQIKVIGSKFGWGQLALALETWRNPPQVLFSPAHTLPIFCNPKVKTVLTIHDTATEFVTNKIKEDALLKFATKKADHIIAVSKSTAKDIQNRFGVDENKISIVYEGYDSSMFYPRQTEETSEVLKKYDLLGEQKYIFALGTLQPRKNFERLIEAFSKLKNSNLKLLIAGGKGWNYKSILEAPEKYGVGERVVFLGHVPDENIPPLLSGAKVFAYPSLYEGFGLPVLEAFACGTPVVTSNTSSLPEVAGNVRVLVTPTSVESIQEGLQKVLDLGVGGREQLVQRGFEQAKKFSWEKSAEESVKTFEKAS